MEIGKQTHHAPFNPSSLFYGTDSPLARLCENLEKEGWALIRVISVHAYESIAVFER